MSLKYFFKNESNHIILPFLYEITNVSPIKNVSMTKELQNDYEHQEHRNYRMIVEGSLYLKYFSRID